MKKIAALIITLIFTLPAAAQSKPVKLADLGWLAGCWEASKPDKGFMLSEQWMKPNGGMMVGMGRTIQDGRAADYEFMRIEQTGDSLRFFAKPKANPDETPFDMIRFSESEVAFENPKHDFPQRVIYRRDGTNLTARIEGTKDGKTRGIDFPYSRAKCE